MRRSSKDNRKRGAPEEEGKEALEETLRLQCERQGAEDAADRLATEN